MPHNRRRCSIRLRGYDYSRTGAYCVTICVQNRECLFGEIVNGGMRLNEYGEIVNATWHDLPNHIGNITLDEFIVMPNHVHGIIHIVHIVGAGSEPAPTKNIEPAPTIKSHALPEIIRQLKTFSSRRINQSRNTPGQPVWQRNYFEHIIRDDKSLFQIRQYIRNNPFNWDNDDENPIGKSPRYVAMPNPQRQTVGRVPSRCRGE